MYMMRDMCDREGEIEECGGSVRGCVHVHDEGYV